MGTRELSVSLVVVCLETSTVLGILYVGSVSELSALNRSSIEPLKYF